MEHGKELRRAGHGEDRKGPAQAAFYLILGLGLVSRAFTSGICLGPSRF